MQADKTTCRVSIIRRVAMGRGNFVGSRRRGEMKALLISVISMVLVAWMFHPYLSRASDGQDLSATTEPSISQLLSAITATQPAVESDFKQVHGNAGYWRLAQNQSGVWWFCSPD